AGLTPEPTGSVPSADARSKQAAWKRFHGPPIASSTANEKVQWKAKRKFALGPGPSISPATQTARPAQPSEGRTMPAKSPEEICSLFKQYMAAGELDSLLTLYDPEAVFLNSSVQVRHGRQEIREELAPLAAAKSDFDFHIRQVIQTGD